METKNQTVFFAEHLFETKKCKTVEAKKPFLFPGTNEQSYLFLPQQDSTFLGETSER